MTTAIQLDHAGARRLAAARMDGSLDGERAAALDQHLDDCPECRRVADALGADASTLRALDLGPVPVAVRADVAIATERGTLRHVGRWVGLIAVGALLVSLFGGGALGGGASSLPQDAPAPRVHWHTSVVDLQATDISMTAGGRVFSPLGPTTQVSSDPGDATSRTLEIEWGQDGIGQRIYLYFANDERTWWVNEIRIYNGAKQGEWLYAKGRFFESPMGQPWRGDADIQFTDPEHRGGLPADLHLTGVTLAMTRSDLVAKPVGAGIKLPVNAQPFDIGGPLHCTGILQLTPRQAQAALLSLGYAVSWRLVTQNGGYWEPRKDAPDGVIQDWDPAVGTSGEIIIAVLPPGATAPFMRPATFPGDCPKADPNAPTPVPETSPAPSRSASPAP